MYLLDTDVVSELRPGNPRPSEAVRAWANSVAETKVFLSAISIVELEQSVRQLERSAPAEGQGGRLWLDGLQAAFAGRVLPFTGDTAVRCARLHVTNHLSYRDSMIAATALEHGFAVVTRNVDTHLATGVKVIDPWQEISL